MEEKKKEKRQGERNKAKQVHILRKGGGVMMNYIYYKQHANQVRGNALRTLEE